MPFIFGNRLQLRGGYFNNGAASGVFALNLNNERAISNNNVGFRVAFSRSQILHTYRVCFQHGGRKRSLFPRRVIRQACRMKSEKFKRREALNRRRISSAE
jgi:hypothetical protein